MDNIKISASFLLPGSVMNREKDSNGDPVKYSKLTLDVIGNKGKHEVLKMKIPKCHPCTQVINMTEKAYNYMMSTAHGYSPSYWHNLSERQRIAEYLKDIQYDLHATSFDFTILDD